MVTMSCMAKRDVPQSVIDVRMRGDFSTTYAMNADVIRECFASYFTGFALPSSTAWRYPSMGALVCEHAEVIPGSALEARYRRGISGYCFDNAQRLALSSRGKLVYVEGYALGRYFPIHHAWCVRVDAPDVVIDATWNEPERCAYIGIGFDTAFVRAYRKGRNDISILDDWRGGYPMLRQGPDPAHLANIGREAARMQQGAVR